MLTAKTGELKLSLPLDSLNSVHAEMTLFAQFGVLRGFSYGVGEFFQAELLRG
jgi:hypothetical protein